MWEGNLEMGDGSSEPPAITSPINNTMIDNILMGIINKAWARLALEVQSVPPEVSNRARGLSSSSS